MQSEVSFEDCGTPDCDHLLVQVSIPIERDDIFTLIKNYKGEDKLELYIQREVEKALLHVVNNLLTNE